MLPSRWLSISIRKRTACVVLFAMLFSALSPAMAAAIFSDRPEILRHMLALPAPAPVAADARDDGCPHEAAQSTHHGQSGTDTRGGDEHAVHGVFCSLCLTASSVVTLLAGTGGAWVSAAASSDALVVREYQFFSAVSFNVCHPRGPPALI